MFSFCTNVGHSLKWVKEVQLTLGCVTIRLGKPNLRFDVRLDLDCQLTFFFFFGINLFFFVVTKWERIELAFECRKNCVNQTFITWDVGKILGKGQVGQNILINLKSDLATQSSLRVFENWNLLSTAKLEILFLSLLIILNHPNPTLLERDMNFSSSTLFRNN